MAIATGLKKNVALQSLSLAANALSSDGGRALLVVLTNNNVVSLNVNQNLISLKLMQDIQTKLRWKAGCSKIIRMAQYKDEISWLEEHQVDHDIIERRAVEQQFTKDNILKDIALRQQQLESLKANVDKRYAPITATYQQEAQAAVRTEQTLQTIQEVIDAQVSTATQVIANLSEKLTKVSTKLVVTENESTTMCRY
jgi:hypothetical protein